MDAHAPPQDGGAPPALPRRTLLLQLQGQPHALRLPLPCASLCLAPLAGSSRGAAGQPPQPVQFEPLLLVEAAGSWDLPAASLCSGATASSAQLPLHLIYATQEGSSAAPLRALAVGRLQLEVSGRGGDSAAQPIQLEGLQCCPLACPSNGATVARITLAARLVPAQRRQLPRPEPQGSQVQASAEAGAGAAPCRPAAKPRRRRVRSASAQTSPLPGQAPPPAGAAGMAWPRGAVPPPRGVVPMAPAPLACWPFTQPAAPWGVALAPMPVQPCISQPQPAVGVPVLPPPQLLGLAQPAPHESAGSPALGPRPAPAPAPAAASAPDPAAQQLAAIRTRVQQAQRAQQAVHEAPGTCLLRSPRKAPGRGPPLQHRLRELPPRDRQARCRCLRMRWQACLAEAPPGRGHAAATHSQPPRPQSLQVSRQAA